MILPTTFAGKSSPSSSPTPSPLLDGLLAYWSLDEATGAPSAPRVDAHADNDLTDNNTVVGAAAKLNNGAQFTAASSQSLTRTTHDLNTGDEDWTFSCWWKGNSTPESSVIAWVEGEWHILHQLSANRITARIITTAGQKNHIITSAYADATWYHLLLWYVSSEQKAYSRINGAAAISTALAAAKNPVTANPFLLGSRHGGSQYCTGIMDEVGFWNRVPTGPEQVALYNSGTPLPYPFNDFQG